MSIVDEISKYPALGVIAKWKTQMARALMAHGYIMDAVKNWREHINYLKAFKFSFDTLIKDKGYNVDYGDGMTYKDALKAMLAETNEVLTNSHALHPYQFYNKPNILCASSIGDFGGNILIYNINNTSLQDTTISTLNNRYGTWRIATNTNAVCGERLIINVDETPFGDDVACIQYRNVPKQECLVGKNNIPFKGGVTYYVSFYARIVDDIPQPVKLRSLMKDGTAYNKELELNSK